MRLASKVEGVVEPPSAGAWAAVAGAVGFAGWFDPEIGVDEGITGVGGGVLAEVATSWIAPLSVRAIAVTTGVDDEMFVAHEIADSGAVGGVGLGGVKI